MEWGSCHAGCVNESPPSQLLGCSGSSFLPCRFSSPTHLTRKLCFVSTQSWNVAVYWVLNVLPETKSAKTTTTTNNYHHHHHHNKHPTWVLQGQGTHFPVGRLSLQGRGGYCEWELLRAAGNIVFFECIPKSNSEEQGPGKMRTFDLGMKTREAGSIGRLAIENVFLMGLRNITVCPWYFAPSVLPP